MNPETDYGDPAKQELIKRIFTSFLDIIVLAHFQQEPFSGYDVVQFAHKQFDILLSPGTIYSTLYAMERDALLESFGNSNKRMFKATEKGMQMAKLTLSPLEIQAFFEKTVK